MNEIEFRAGMRSGSLDCIGSAKHLMLPLKLVATFALRTGVRLELPGCLHCNLMMTHLIVDSTAPMKSVPIITRRIWSKFA